MASETLPQPPGRGPGPTDPAGAGRAVADGLVERILAAAGGSTFDFRVFACPDDPDAHLFDDWVARYRRKWALAQVLAPDTVMDLGAGYGYAAAAFLTARPGAAYLRVDLDDDDPDDAARTWAAGALAGFDVATSPLPVAGAAYDLAHVGGPPDGDALFAALELALGHARHLVVDDYHVRSRFLAANEFLHQHRDELRAWWAVPGLGGELVVAVADDVVAGPADGRGSAPTSGALRHLYDEHYFLQDCDGHEGYKRDNGGRLRDPRLAAVASIGELRGPRRVLDLGCGRGELTAHFARHGADVTAVDYSADAVELARRALADTPQLQSRVQFVVGDVNTVPIDGPFDLAVASDLVEHLTPAELDALYARVADLLAPAGVLVIHTFPNRWFYEREYPRRRAQAQALGAYLPPEPRSRYERLMHINEQSPDDLRQQLGKHFGHVVVWSGEPADLGRTLGPGDHAAELEVAPGLYALASAAPVTGGDLHRDMAMTPLSADDVAGLRLTVTSCPNAVRAGRSFVAGVALANGGGRALRSNGPNPFHLAYRWSTADGQPVADGRRSLVFPWLPAGASDQYDVTVDAPDRPGRYILRVTAVQEFVAWFDDPAGGLAEDVVVTVGAAPGRGTS